MRFLGTQFRSGLGRLTVGLKGFFFQPQWSNDSVHSCAGDHNGTQCATKGLPTVLHQHYQCQQQSTYWKSLLMKSHTMCDTSARPPSRCQLIPRPTRKSYSFSLKDVFLTLLSLGHNTCYSKPQGPQVLYDILVLSNQPCPPFWALSHTSPLFLPGLLYMVVMQEKTSSV